MSMMHIKYPRKKGYFHWDELGCLARALGFQSELFHHHMPDEYPKHEEPGISFKDFYYLIEVQKQFNNAMDRTLNIHTDEWNLAVLLKAIRLLDTKVLTYSELHDIRMAFQMYEDPDTKGMVIDEKILLRSIKMCGRMISSMKMMHRVKHMREHFEEKNRIQLHEFLDLILWCDLHEEYVNQVPQNDISKDDAALYKVESFDEMLSHYDEKLNARLNQQYKKEEWKFSKEQHGSKKMPKDVPPVDPWFRINQVRTHTEKYRPLQTELITSQSRVYQAKAGYVRDRPISAPELHGYDDTEFSSKMSIDTVRPHTVADICGHIIRPKTSEGIPLSEIQNLVPRPHTTEYQRPQTPCAVTRDEIQDTRDEMDAIKFEMETIEMKYQQMLNEDMDYLIPGYREKMSSRPSTVPANTESSKRPKEPRPSTRTLTRLSYHHRRDDPRPAHGRQCDARFRGWHKVKSNRGRHFILVEPKYDNSPHGRLLTKLYRTTTAQTGTDRSYLHRYTMNNQVAKEPRPATAPELSDRASNTISSESFNYNNRLNIDNGGHQFDYGSGQEGMSYRSRLSIGNASSSVDWNDFQMYGPRPPVDPFGLHANDDVPKGGNRKPSMFGRKQSVFQDGNKGKSIVQNKLNSSGHVAFPEKETNELKAGTAVESASHIPELHTNETPNTDTQSPIRSKSNVSSPGVNDDSRKDSGMYSFDPRDSKASIKGNTSSESTVPNIVITSPRSYLSSTTASIKSGAKSASSGRSQSSASSGTSQSSSRSSSSKTASQASSRSKSSSSESERFSVGSKHSQHPSDNKSSASSPRVQTTSQTPKHIFGPATPSSNRSIGETNKTLENASVRSTHKKKVYIRDPSPDSSKSSSQTGFYYEFFPEELTDDIVTQYPWIMDIILTDPDLNKEFFKDASLKRLANRFDGVSNKLVGRLGKAVVKIKV